MALKLHLSVAPPLRLVAGIVRVLPLNVPRLATFPVIALFVSVQLAEITVSDVGAVSETVPPRAVIGVGAAGTATSALVVVIGGGLVARPV